MYFHRYRGGLQAHESEVIRQLRRRGYAVAVIPPQDVGDPVNRGSVEGAMVKAGKATTKKEATR